MTGMLAVMILSALVRPAAAVESSTRVAVRLGQSVSTSTARVGDPVALKTENLVIIDRVPIPAGSDAAGVVTRGRHPGRIHGRAEIAIGIMSVTRPDGTVLPLTGTFTATAPAAARGGTPPPDPTVPILAGMVAGYGTAALASKVSNSEDAIVNAGAAAGIATGVLIGVMKRGEDLLLHRGELFEVIVERPR